MDKVKFSGELNVFASKVSFGLLPLDVLNVLKMVFGIVLTVYANITSTFQTISASDALQIQSIMKQQEHVNANLLLSYSTAHVSPAKLMKHGILSKKNVFVHLPMSKSMELVLVHQIPVLHLTDVNVIKATTMSMEIVLLPVHVLLDHSKSQELSNVSVLMESTLLMANVFLVNPIKDLMPIKRNVFV